MVASNLLRRRRTWLTALAVPAAISVTLIAPAPVSARVASTAASSQTITVDGTSAGQTFDGIGALSAGASSRLLIDYPAQERSQILNYLFKPDYGANLQILKVEIGGDTNSTDGTEPSHMTTPTEVDCNAGYEWSLMEQAKRLNPDIKLYGLEWGAPGWVGDGTGTVWTSQNITYLLKWLGCAREHGLTINYLGGWNEEGFNANWYVELRQALDVHGYSSIQIVADDSYDWTTLAATMQSDLAFDNAVSIIGEHYPCPSSTSCPTPSSVAALGKPVWASEQGSAGYDTGAAGLADDINNAYVDGQMTGTINWSLIWSAYSDLIYEGDGLMLANTPWSGNYTVGQSIWAVAQTTQFTQPGWHYLNSGSTTLSGGGSVASLRSPSSGNWSSILDTSGATAAQRVTYQIQGGLSTSRVHVWATNLDSGLSSQWFKQLDSVQPQNGSFTLTLQPNYLYTVTTTLGQHKGAAVPPPSAPWKLPYAENFNEYSQGVTPRYFSDLGGVFQTASCAAGGPGPSLTGSPTTSRPQGSSNMCLEQQIAQQPVQWDSLYNYPATVIGDPTSWKSYDATVDALLPQAGYVELDGRVQGPRDGLTGYHFRISNTGAWLLYSEDSSGDQTTLASGSTSSFGIDTWHQLGLRMQGDEISASLDGHPLASVLDDSYHVGQVGLEVSPWVQAQFDNLSVQSVPAVGASPVVGPVTPNPVAISAGEASTVDSSVTNPGEPIPQSQMTATATSTQPGYPAGNAIDGDSGTLWSTAFSPTMVAPPQSITLDLGKAREVDRLAYLPRQDGNPNGTIEQYEIEVSTDGTSFTEVSSGTWPEDPTLKNTDFTPVDAKYVRLVAVTGYAATVTAAEINIYGWQPGQQPDATAVSARLQVPAGWSTTPVATAPTTLSGGQTVPLSWTLTVPQSAAPGSYQADVEVTYREGGITWVGKSPITVNVDFIPQTQMTATATSAQPGYPASNAIDDNPATLWSTEFSPTKVAPPQSITLDLGGTYDVQRLAYLPRQDGNPNGTIEQYEIEVSTDGTSFTEVSSGTWPEDPTLKSADFTPVDAKYVRLVAVTGYAATVTAAEINIFGSAAS